MAKDLTFGSTIVSIPESADVSEYLVYCLIDPCTNSPRYIGKSCSGLNRVMQHYSESSLKEGNTPKNNWIRSLKQKNMKYTYAILFSLNSSNLTKNEINLALYEKEQEFIRLFRKDGHNLTNLSDGGPGAAGYARSTETKEKQSIAAKKRPLPQALLDRQVSSGNPIKPKSEMPSAIFRKRKYTTFTDRQSSQPVYIMSPFNGDVIKIESLRLAERTIGEKCNKMNIKRVLDTNKLYYGYYWMTIYE